MILAPSTAPWTGGTTAGDASFAFCFFNFFVVVVVKNWCGAGADELPA
jgi:hypothetical protein